MLFGAKAGDVIWYYNTEDKMKGGVSFERSSEGATGYKQGNVGIEIKDEKQFDYAPTLIRQA
jgi:predicted transport protein